MGEVYFFTLGIDAFTGGHGREETFHVTFLGTLFHCLPHPVQELLLGRWRCVSMSCLG